MSDNSDSTAIQSWEDAQAQLATVKSSWETIYNLSLAESIMGVIPIFNVWSLFVRAILALVSYIIYAQDMEASLSALSVFFNDRNNWKDQAAFDAAQARRLESYTAYDSARWFTKVAENEQYMEEFEASGGSLNFSLPYWIVASLIATPFLYALTPVTLSLSFWFFWFLLVSSFWADIWILIGLTGTSSNYPLALFAWFPDDAAAN